MTLTGILGDHVETLDPRPATEDAAILAALRCARDWDRVEVRDGGRVVAVVRGVAVWRRACAPL